jgi:DNA-binding transcriptional regulator/RsmH inhibitor MraZ
MTGSSEILNLDYQYERKIAADFRIELPSNYCEQFKNYGIREFYLGRFPDSKALALCPKEYWDKWVKESIMSFPKQITQIYFSTKSPPVNLNQQGKIRIPKPYRGYFDRKNNKILIFGKRYYLIICSKVYLPQEDDAIDPKR